MKTIVLFRNVLKIGICFLLFQSTSFKAFSQCPTVTNSNPPPICDSSGITFQNLTSLLVGNGSIVENGATVRWFNFSTGGTAFTPTQLVNREGVFFIDDNNPSVDCSPRKQINIDFSVDPISANLDKVFCSNEPRLVQNYIDEIVTPNVPPLGSSEIYLDGTLTTLANPSSQINSFTNFFVVILDALGCKSQAKVGRAYVEQTPANPNPPNPQAFCSENNATVGLLNPGTTGAPISWYTDVNSNGDPISTSFVPSTTALVDGQTYYVQIGTVCPSEAMPVLVNIDNPVDAGTPTPIEFCEDDLTTTPSLDLFDQLAGEDAGGTWSDDNTPVTGALTGSDVNLTLLPIGVSVFTYTVISNNACPDATSSVSITIFETLSSGIVSPANPAIYCEKDLPTAFDLFSLLDNEDPNGQWTQGTTSTDPVVTSPINLTGLSVGTHNFTYTQNLSPSPCLEESTIVQVTVLQDPNAGTANNQIFCENDLAANSPFNLYNALTAPYDSGGTWTDATNTIVPDPLNLDITSFTVAVGQYNFTYTVDNGTCTDDETISITIEPAPESGTVVATFPEFCEGAAPTSYDLFDLLNGEDQTGVWHSGTDNSGATVSNPVDLSVLAVGSHSFTFDVNAIGTCDDVLVTVSITINPIPVTGTPLPTVFCENDLASNSPLELFDRLSGEDAGGTWADDNTSGALTGSNVNLNILTIGAYSFTYSITDAKGCSNSSTVTVQVDDAPESGTANAPIEFCLSTITAAQTVNLFELLTDEDQTGSWNDDDASAALSGNTVTIDGLAAGTYNFTYDVNAIGTCDDVNVTVSIIINDIVAPSALATQEFCDSATLGNLVTTTGTTIKWYDDATGGTALADTIALVDGETYYATQTDASTGCESFNRTLVTTTIHKTPISGNPNTTAIVACNDNNSIDLFTGLDGTQDSGGVWQDTDGTTALTGNIFDATGIAAGTYQFTYFIAGSAPCVDASTLITVTIEEPLNPGTSTTLDICSNNGTTDLFSLLGSADTNGTWSPAMASTTGVFDPLVDAGGTYTYTLSNACGIFTSNVVVSVTQAPNAGTDNSVTICVIDGTTDLFTLLGTAQSGGSWTYASASVSGQFDPSVDPAGVYTYTITAIAPCNPDSTAEITVAVADTPTPTVTNNNPEFCLVDSPIVSDLDSTISSTGTINWYEDAALTLPLIGTEALVDGEDYYATQTNGSGCESSTSVQIDVTVNDSPTPTLINPNMEYCINDGPTINDLSLNITEINSTTDNVIWYDAATNGTAISNSTSLVGFTNYYAALVDAVTGCESSVRLEISPNLAACGTLVLPDGFSPNGDGTNDTYDYDNLDVLYPKFEIEIYNRYGSMVYKGNAKTPRFNGNSNQGRTLGGSDLPVGLYYYIFNFNDGVNKPKQGNLYLSR